MHPVGLPRVRVSEQAGERARHRGLEYLPNQGAIQRVKAVAQGMSNCCFIQEGEDRGGGVCVFPLFFLVLLVNPNACDGKNEKTKTIPGYEEI